MKKKKKSLLKLRWNKMQGKSEPYEKWDKIWVDLACRTDIRMGQDDREI